MTLKAYKMYGHYVDSDNVIFEEDMDDEYINDWDIDPEEYYDNLLKENTYIYNQEIKEYS
jgi:hypothetical protein